MTENMDELLREASVKAPGFVLMHAQTNSDPYFERWECDDGETSYGGDTPEEAIRFMLTEKTIKT